MQKRLCAAAAALLFLMAACENRQSVQASLQPTDAPEPVLERQVADATPRPEPVIPEVNRAAEAVLPTVAGLSGNMMHHGLADGNEEMVVYAWENQIVRVNPDGTGRQVISQDWAQCICLYGDWILYRSVGLTSDPGFGIYKMKTDGTQRTQLTSQTTQYIYVVDDWVYYMDWSYTTDICRMRLDGTERETLYAGHYDCLSTDGYYLYFSDFHQDIYIKAPLDGGDYDILIPSYTGACPRSRGGGYILSMEPILDPTGSGRTEPGENPLRTRFICIIWLAVITFITAVGEKMWRRGRVASFRPSTPNRCTASAIKCFCAKRNTRMTPGSLPACRFGCKA